MSSFDAGIGTQSREADGKFGSSTTSESAVDLDKMDAPEATPEKKPYVPTEDQLVNQVSLRPGAAGTCSAWMDSKDRVCGDKCEGQLCTRHTNVAKKRFAVNLAKAVADDAKRKAARAAKRPGRIAKLAEIDKELDQIDPFRTPRDRQDFGMPSNSRIHRLAVLHEERRDLVGYIGSDPYEDAARVKQIQAKLDAIDLQGAAADQHERDVLQAQQDGLADRFRAH